MNRLRSFFRLFSVALLLNATLPLGAWAQAVADTALPARPNPPRLVNDLAGALQPDERARLEQKLVAYDDSTSTQIVIVVVKNTGPYEIGDFAYSLGRKWGVGRKEKNNGVVIAWATETRKIYIATGPGISGAVPDAIAKRIISEKIVPNFKQGQFYQGLDAATTEIFQRARGEFKGEPRRSDGEGGGGSILGVIIVIIILIWIFSRFRGGGRGGSRYRGGGGFFPPVFFPTTFSGGGGSSWGGGGGGGGFGGFGGGSFDGGGAGGDY